MLQELEAIKSANKNKQTIEYVNKYILLFQMTPRMGRNPTNNIEKPEDMSNKVGR